MRFVPSLAPRLALAGPRLALLVSLAVAGCAPAPAPTPIEDMSVAPSCTDTTKNGDETDVDCGGSCATKCDVARACAKADDCRTGVCTKGLCTATCSDKLKDQDETDVDCGGINTCERCKDGQACTAGSDCVSHVCNGGKCEAPSCTDRAMNGDEVDVDCGGACPACGDGKHCMSDKGCMSGICSSGVCVSPPCADGQKNGSESDLDCGGACSPCDDGKACGSGKDCKSGVCPAGMCVAATCKDGVKNGAETDADCGGGTCPACAPQKACVKPSDCASGVCAVNLCAAPSCSDNVKNGTETDVDCGGNGCAPCADKKACGGNADCASGVCTGNACAAPACGDKVKNGGETDVDCGGPCAPCADGKACARAADCANGVCTMSTCVAAGCGDKVKNGAETDVDCGGMCPACVDGKQCVVGADCASRVCTGGACLPPTCSDTQKNGAETDIDCGGGACGRCAVGGACKVAGDCASGVCTGGKCLQPTCSDGVKNGDEGDIDCGGKSCTACGNGKSCNLGTDCQSLVCGGGNKCQAPNCGDGVKNQDETDADCGGKTCAACPNGKLCVVPNDCVNRICTGGSCVAATCNDTVRNGNETDIDCGGACKTCPIGAACFAAADCSSGVCLNGRCAAPGCGDGVKNGGETDIDCGGLTCAPCAVGKTCGGNGDCASGSCAANKCVGVSCQDMLKNGNETDVDCGGACAPCVVGKLCLNGPDCTSLVCLNQKCAAPSCSDSVKNALETDVDCGGGTCGKCASGKHCTVNGDCTSALCANGLCVAPACTDVIQNGSETDVDCGGPDCSPCPMGKSCNVNADCTSGACGGGKCVGCVQASMCPGQDTECQTRTCNGGTCGFSFTANGTALMQQVPGDCQKKVCDGSGNVASVADDTDLPADGNQCTNDVCTNGVISNPPVNSGVACNQNGGLVCNGTSACVQCVAPSGCPGADNECQTRTCQNNACGFNFTMNGTPVAMQLPGDCKKNVCDGAGMTTTAADNADLPVDGNQCTADVCTNGVSSNPPVNPGVACNQNGGVLCDGMGSCVQCLVAADCPGMDTECARRTCMAGVCGTSFIADGTVLMTQTAGDCQKAVCNGVGGTRTIADNSDLPVDNNQCTNDVCTNGVPSNPALMLGAMCSQNNGTQCDGMGKCVQCVVAATCPGMDTECQTRTCTNGACGFTYAVANTPVAMQTAGDCKKNVCDGMGNIVGAADNADLPTDDGNQCTLDTCVNGAVARPPVPQGTSCNQNGGALCSVTSCIVAPTLTVFRAGDGTAALASTATAAFLVQYKFDGTVIGNPIAMPIAANGNQGALTCSGTATSEGMISRSDDGRYLIVGGYNAAPGTTVTTATAMTVNRVIGRMNAALQLDTTTKLNNIFDAGNIRGAGSDDGSRFWASGSNSGVVYAAFGSSTGTGLTNPPTNVRMVHVVGGQVYATSGSTPYVNVFTVGSGLPTTAPQTATSFPGMPTAAGPSPYAFALVDTDNTLGYETLYVTDDRAVASGGGVQKWKLANGMWTLSSTISAGLTTGVRGLATFVTSRTMNATTVTLFVTSTESSANKLYKIVDDGVNAPMATVAVTAPANTAFRGVAISPQ